MPLFSKYAKNAASGANLTAELTRLREAANREWNEGSRKEVEVAMYKRRYSRLDAQTAKSEDWIAHASGQTAAPNDEDREN